MDYATVKMYPEAKAKLDKMADQTGHSRARLVGVAIDNLTVEDVIETIRSTEGTE